MLASGFLLPEFQKPKRPWVNELKETSSRLTAPPHRFPAIRECPIPCRHSNSPCGPGFCNFSALVGVSMHAPAHAFLSLGIGGSLNARTCRCIPVTWHWWESQCTHLPMHSCHLALVGVSMHAPADASCQRLWDASSHKSLQEANLLIRVSTYLITYGDLRSSTWFSPWKVAAFEYWWLQEFQELWLGLPHICLAPPRGGWVLCTHRWKEGPPLAHQFMELKCDW